jgi:hypothetical protein
VPRERAASRCRRAEIWGISASSGCSCRRCRIAEPRESSVRAPRSPSGRTPADLRSSAAALPRNGTGAVAACSHSAPPTGAFRSLRSLLGELVSEADSIRPSDSFAGSWRDRSSKSRRASVLGCRRSNGDWRRALCARPAGVKLSGLGQRPGMHPNERPGRRTAKEWWSFRKEGTPR